MLRLIDSNNISLISIDENLFLPKLGLVKLELTYYTQSYSPTLLSCRKFRGEQYLSNILFKQILSIEGMSIVHGPCLTDSDGLFDLANCLHSKFWVRAALQWSTRSNNAWPYEPTKKKIISHGVLFVPVGDKGSPNEEFEWRISFSVGEKFLIYTFSHTQLLCYALMKILLKDVIDIDSRCKKMLCSYFLKTIIFWLSEELQPSVWTPDNLIPCFMRCFSRLIYCVQYQVCPHYFIPENNLFQDKLEGQDGMLLLRNLQVLLSYDWRCILFSDQISKSQIFVCNFQNEQGNLFFEDMYKIFTSDLLQITLLMGDKINNCRRAVHQMMPLCSKKIKYVYIHFLSVTCSQRCQFIDLSSENNNKNQYTRYNLCLSYLLMNIYHDAVSGWLMLASFFYKRKQYINSLIIIMHSLSKCTREKICISKEMLVLQRYFLSLNSLNQKGTLRLARFLLLDLVKFSVNSSLMPSELQIEGRHFFIPPVVYGCFLSFLCQFHLKNSRACRNSIEDLKWTIENGYFITEKCNAANSYYCLGTVLQIIGDTESARRVFVQSLELCTHPMFAKGLKRLSLIKSI